MKVLLLLIITCVIVGCSNKTHYMNCEGEQYKNYFDYQTNEEIKTKEKKFNSFENITIKKNIFGYFIDNVRCTKNEEDILECGDQKCYFDFISKFSNKSYCKDKFWDYSIFDTMSGNYSMRMFWPHKNENEYVFEGGNYQCKEIKKALED